ncbi:xanthine dehydrogenase family protein molybdopterin-binding subunit [Amorphus orientalis]|uniref:Carbon-monoxide dehydrogenase large subunit n=1 Tax=Amorphus orientalis TaxID=649198 RepID=A0AAE3VKF2_9HYPH|nr:xanthine dehydrogenase family protein molybdopterin-binding subunit [Amorphus orientalis]MDQ0314034.1 carbon-monoxide dehydrogenase large subunit [Amorphus orientalis]
MSVRIGRSEFRLEDTPLVTGNGRYTADETLPGEAALVFLRSPVASGSIRTLDVAAARAAPGVLAVLTAADLPETFRPILPALFHPGPDGRDMHVPPYRALADGTVRYVGDLVAAVVAETRAAAEDALELIEFDIDEAEPVIDPVAARSSGSPAVWPDCPDNICFRVVTGDPQAVRQAIAAAPNVVRERFEITRVTAAPMEVRGARGTFDPDSGRYTLHVGTQAPHRLAESVAEMMSLAPGSVHVTSRDTGGSFGMKNAHYPEYPVILHAAETTGRPIRWEPARTESLLADSHSREQVVQAALALDDDGRFLALEVEICAAVGAYLGPMSVHPMVANVGSLSGVYTTPQIAATVDGVFTNTQNMAPYRGAGRPEAIYIIERMADVAARRLGIDPAVIRRRNMIPAEAMPYDTGFVFTYDSGDFPTIFDEALRRADWAGFEARRREAEARGRLSGIGLTYAIEIAGGPPAKPMPEYARIEVEADGTVALGIGGGDTGMGHRTTYAGILSERIGVDPEKIRFATGDTDAVARGTGSFGSRTTAAVGTAMLRAFDVLVEKARARTAEALEVAEADVEFTDGAFTIVGTDRRITLPDVARHFGEGFEADDFSAADNANFPNGCHVCEVEVDPETGLVEILRYTVVDDVGTVLNEALVYGQIHGGIVQGAGQALMERMVYDRDSGQPLTASFLDYAMPRAGEFPLFDISCHPVPTTTNALGAKGAGEAGVVGSLPALVNAVVDALVPYGIDHIDMPLTPDRVWEAIRSASR